VTRSGRRSFLAGGELAVPIATRDGRADQRRDRMEGVRREARVHSDG
jgi:hypothetical protein